MARRKPKTRSDQDLFQRTFSRIFQELSGAGVAFTGLILAVLLIMAILWGVSNSYEQAEAAAWEKVAEALETRDPKDQLERIEKVMKEVSDTEAHPSIAIVLAARLHEKAIVDPTLSKSKREELLKRSRSLYEGVLRNHPDHYLAPKARGNLAMVMEDAGDYDEAEKAFAAAAEACQGTGFEFMAGEMLWGQARCAHRAGRSDEAIRLLNRATSRPGTGAGSSGWKEVAQHLRDSLRKLANDRRRTLQGVERDRSPEAESQPDSDDDKDKQDADKKEPASDAKTAPKAKD